jgi:hypothetical protein
MVLNGLNQYSVGSVSYLIQFVLMVMGSALSVKLIQMCGSAINLCLVHTIIHNI